MGSARSSAAQAGASLDHTVAIVIRRFADRSYASAAQESTNPLGFMRLHMKQSSLAAASAKDAQSSRCNGLSRASWEASLLSSAAILRKAQAQALVRARRLQCCMDAGEARTASSRGCLHRSHSMPQLIHTGHGPQALEPDLPRAM